MAAVEVPMGLCIGRKAARTSPSRPLTAKETGWKLVCGGEKEDPPYDTTQLECVGIPRGHREITRAFGVFTGGPL